MPSVHIKRLVAQLSTSLQQSKTSPNVIKALQIVRSLYFYQSHHEKGTSMNFHRAWAYYSAQRPQPDLEYTNTRDVPRSVPCWRPQRERATMAEARLFWYFHEHAGDQDLSSTIVSESEVPKSPDSETRIVSSSPHAPPGLVNVPAVKITATNNTPFEFASSEDISPDVTLPEIKAANSLEPRKPLLMPKLRRSPRHSSTHSGDQAGEVVTTIPEVEPTAKSSRKRSGESSGGPSKRKKKSAPSGMDDFAVKKPKAVSKHALGSRDWCKLIKAIPIKQLPVCYPPKSAYTAQIVSSSPSECYKASMGYTAKTFENHPLLARQEQRFVAAFGGRLTEDAYIDCKSRIFAAYYWRTQQDGIYHNTETSQQVCRIDVKVSSTMHKWFNSMQMFQKYWVEEGTNLRPPHMQNLDHSPYMRRRKEPEAVEETGSSSKPKRSRRVSRAKCS